MKNDTIKVARMYDPAFACATLSDVKRYAETRDEADMPRTDDARGPILFHTRRLTRSEVLEHVEAVAGDEARWVRAFNRGVVKITGGRFGDGVEPAGAAESPRQSWTDEELDKARISTLDQKEIGGVIYAMSTRPFDCSVPYRLLPSSAAVWDDSARQYAAQTRARAPQSSTPPKGE